MNATFPLPPTQRDFDIHRMHLVYHHSTWRIAESQGISQTRVRQIIKRVCDWLAHNLPVKTEAQQEQEARLAQHLAADQLQHQCEELENYWTGTGDPKYLRQKVRVIAALARLGLVPGTIESLAADAEEASGAGVSPAAAAASSNPPPGDCSPKSEPTTAAAPPTASQPDTSDVPPETSHRFELPAEKAIEALSRFEERLLALEANGVYDTPERVTSFQQTLAELREAKAAAQLRLSPNVSGAKVTVESPSFNPQPTAQECPGSMADSPSPAAPG